MTARLSSRQHTSVGASKTPRSYHRLPDEDSFRWQAFPTMESHVFRFWRITAQPEVAPKRAISASATTCGFLLKSITIPG